jgi:hypothetical protein
MDEVRLEAKVYSPWNLKLSHPDLLAHPLQKWIEDRNFDVEYHVRRSALPTPGDERELRYFSVAAYIAIMLIFIGHRGKSILLKA